ncbi:MAG TPA: hypothetical protein VF100_09360 [Thermoanaerobaculia bacterium]
MAALAGLTALAGLPGLAAPPLPPLASPPRVALGAGMLLAIGLLAVAAAWGRPARRRPRMAELVEGLALAVVAGPALAIPLLMAASLAGLPLRGRPTVLVLGALAAALAGVAAVRWRSPRARRPATALAAPAAPAAAPRPLLWAGRLTLAAALLLALFKLALVPLWSWDHFAIWGLKARVFAAEGSATPRVVAGIGVHSTVPDYPLGVPLAWVAATLGALPGEAVVRGVHLAWLLALVALVHSAARRVGGGALVPLAAAGFVAVSPLAWDSVHVGLADLPLGLVAVAAVAAAGRALAEAAGRPMPGPGGGSRDDRLDPAGRSASSSVAGGWALAGLAVGFLPWVKSEGTSLAAMLLVALAAWRWRAGRPGRRADLAALAVPAAVLGAGANAVGRILPRGVTFFDGLLRDRLADRLADPSEVLAPFLAELASWQWLGVWAALLVVLVAAAVRRRLPALLLAAVVALQLAVYLGVFFVTFLDVADHVATALHRIAAALVPLAVLAAAALAGPGGHGTRSARRITP